MKWVSVEEDNRNIVTIWWCTAITICKFNAVGDRYRLHVWREKKSAINLIIGWNILALWISYICTRTSGTNISSFQVCHTRRRRKLKNTIRLCTVLHPYPKYLKMASSCPTFIGRSVSRNVDWSVRLPEDHDDNPEAYLMSGPACIRAHIKYPNILLSGWVTDFK